MEVYQNKELKGTAIATTTTTTTATSATTTTSRLLCRLIEHGGRQQTLRRDVALVTLLERGGLESSIELNREVLQMM